VSDLALNELRQFAELYNETLDPLHECLLSSGELPRTHRNRFAESFPVLSERFDLRRRHSGKRLTQRRATMQKYCELIALKTAFPAFGLATHSQRALAKQCLPEEEYRVSSGPHNFSEVLSEL